MADIVKRSDVVTRMGKNEQQEIEVVVGKVSQKLREAKDLPVIFAQHEFGSTAKVRAVILQKTKDAGWRCDEKDSSKTGAGGSITYELS